ncbi:MAG: hypothetical protein JKY92_02295, partial [Magnetovibrio sp.]|nr:hypothetical protein [Magnetovibrio sp.]
MVRRIRKNGLNSPFATTNKRTPGAPLGTTSSGSSRTPPGQRGCEWTNCVETGEFRTAKSPREMSEHVWLCSEHIREHNKTWNYFEGLNDDEVEAIIKNDTVWQRPTWELGSKSDAEKSRAFADGTRIRDDFGVLNENVDPRVKHNLP